jgi:ribosomal protein S18 acetylase RimI-like enzyme
VLANTKDVKLRGPASLVHVEVCFQLHPALRTAELVENMIDTAEQNLALQTLQGTRELTIWVNEHDLDLQDKLVQRGYTCGATPENQHRRDLSAPIDAAPPAAGYIVRSLGDAEELPARSYLSWQAFHPDEPDEKYRGWEWYRNIQRMPMYRRDLDLVAATDDGALAAFCTVWFDDVTRTGAFEPVGTAPAHQRRGLGKALLCEGLRRLKQLGATQATVGSYSQRARGLYIAAGFSSIERSFPWTKML